MPEEQTASIEKCIHGLQKRFCGLCTNPNKPRATRVYPSKVSNPHHVGAKDDRFTVVYGKDLLVGAPRSDTHVHFIGFSTVSAVSRLLNYFPQLKVLNFSPSVARHRHDLFPALRKLLDARGIALQFEHVTGRGSTDLKDGHIDDPRWLALRGVLLRLPEEKRAELDQLANLGFQEAVCLKRYFLIDYDSERVCLRDIADSLGYKYYAQASLMLHAFLFYLDPVIKAGNRAKNYAATLAKKIKRFKDKKGLILPTPTSST